jgi:acetylornithine deacetylase
MKTVFERLRSDPALQDTNYDPPFSDFNLVLDNHGTANNVTVALATAHIKFRYSRGVDPQPILDAVRGAASRAGLNLTEAREGAPPELALDHPLVALAVRHTNQPATTAPYGTDASELQGLAPCVVLGPGSIATAHTPHECVALADLEAACELFGRILAAE